MVYTNRLNINTTIKIALYYVENLDYEEDLIHCAYVNDRLTCSEQEYYEGFKVSIYFSVDDHYFRVLFIDDNVIVYHENPDEEKLEDEEILELFVFEKKSISNQDYIRYHNHFHNCDMGIIDIPTIQ